VKVSALPFGEARNPLPSGNEAIANWDQWPQPPPDPAITLASRRTRLPEVGASVTAGDLAIVRGTETVQLSGARGALVLRCCVKYGDPATTLNMAIQSEPRFKRRGVLRRGLDASPHNPRLYGTPCRLYGGGVHHAIVTRIGKERLCLGVAFLGSRAVLVEVRNVHYRFDVCSAVDEGVSEALRSLEWQEMLEPP